VLSTAQDENPVLLVRAGPYTIEVIRGDLGSVAADGIVCPTSPNLVAPTPHRIDSHLHAKAGPAVALACRVEREQRGLLRPGDVVASEAGNLSARILLHGVRPVWHTGTWTDVPAYDEALRRFYGECLALAERLDCVSLAFPSNVCSEMFGMPIERAARIAARACAAHVSRWPPAPRVIRFVVQTGYAVNPVLGDVRAYRKALAVFLEGISFSAGWLGMSADGQLA
jgi:O-acetyl-ADP-ribose deacetylase (regulator of RNase III)